MDQSRSEEKEADDVLDTNTNSRVNEVLEAATQQDDVPQATQDTQSAPDSGSSMGHNAENSSSITAGDLTPQTACRGRKRQAEYELESSRTTSDLRANPARAILRRRCHARGRTSAVS